ncbi:hypothetical protein ACRAWG_15845 [Methylobacterium sp. P31]
MPHTPRWPNGPEICIGVSDIGLCLSHDATPSGAVAVENFGGMHGRLDGRALAARIRELQTSLAVLVTRTSATLDYEYGVIVGLGVGLLSALGVAVEYEPVEITPTGRVLH